MHDLEGLRFTMIIESFVHTLRVGLKSIGVHRLRSTLTMSGIVLGVASVIMMVAVGEAARQKAIDQIKDLGATNLIVRSVKPAADDNKQDKGQFLLSYGLTCQGMGRVAETIPPAPSVPPPLWFPQDIR